MIETKLMPAEEVGRRVDETLKGLNLPADFVRWTSTLETDWQGDPLARVTLILRDGVSGTPRFKELLRQWDLAIGDALREVLTDRYPHLAYRSESDQKLVESGVPLR